MNGPVERRLELRSPLDLGLTLGPLRHGFGDPTIVIEPRRAWRATRTPEGPGTELIELTPGEIAVSAWGPGASWLIGNAPELLGQNDDPDILRPRDRIVAELKRQTQGLRIGRSDAVVEALIPTVLEQKVSGRAAREAYRRIVYSFGEPAPGPHRLMLAPSPDAIATLAYHDLHPFGVERRRADTLRVACSYAHRLEQTCSMPLEDAYRRLHAVPGVGPWTSSIVGHIAYGDPDAVTVGDFHLPHVVAWTLAGEARASDSRMLELLEPYRGQRGRVIRLIEARGAQPPRFGPRMEIRTIANL